MNEINNIIAETPAINQTVTYPIKNNPKIVLNCITNNFVSPLNNIQIILNDSPTDSDYSIKEYFNAINKSISNATINTEFLKGPPITSNYSYDYNINPFPQYSYSYLDKNDNFNLFLKINKIFDEKMYRLDFTNTYLNEKLNIGNTLPITNNDTIKITGYINNGNIIISSGYMPKVDLSQVKAKISFNDNSGNTFGTSTYGPLYISKPDNNFLDSDISKNWIINSNYYKYTITEKIYTIRTNSFDINNKKIDISSNTINIKNNSFNVINNIINYNNNSLILPIDISTVYFDNYNYKLNIIDSSALTINGNNWNIKGSKFYIDNSNNWNINGNTFITNDVSWNIFNNNFILSNTKSFSDNIELSGNLLQILNTNSFYIKKINPNTGSINIYYDNSWNLNSNDISLNNNVYTTKTNIINTNTTVNNPIIINNITNTYYNSLYQTLNFYDLSVNIQNGLYITSKNNNNDVSFNSIYKNNSISNNILINCKSIKIYNGNTIIYGNNIFYNNILYNYQNFGDLTSSIPPSVIDIYNNIEDQLIITIFNLSSIQDSIQNIKIIGNVKISSISDDNFLTNFLLEKYPVNKLLYSSNSFYVNNYDNNILTISGDFLDASYNIWKIKYNNSNINGNPFSISKNNNWNMIGQNIFVKDSSFQIFESTIALPSSKLSVKSNLSFNDSSFNISSGVFFTDITGLTVNSTKVDISTNYYDIYGNTYQNPTNTILIGNNNIYTFNNTGFNTNQTLVLPNNNITCLSGTSFSVNKNNISRGYDITSSLLSVSADTINISNNGNITFIGKTYSQTQNPITFGSKLLPRDFSINVIYTQQYCSLTNISSNSGFSSNYLIDVSDTILKIYPRFPNTINTFGNENDISYNIINNTGKQIICNSINELEQNINSLINNFLDTNNENIFSGSKISITYNNSTLQPTVDSILNIFVKKQLKNKDYAISFIDDKNIINSWKQNFFIDISNSYPLINTTYNYSYLNIDTIMNIVTIKGYKPIDTFIIDFVNNINNILTFVAYEDGTISNNIQLKVPIYDGSGNKIIYSRNVLINTLNNLLYQTINTNNYYNAYGSYFNTIIINDLIYVQFVSNINIIYTSQNYNIVFYDTISFVECYVGAKSVRNTTWDTTIGWILGFRNNSEYNLYNYLQIDNTSQIKGDTAICSNLFNYFLLCIDDFTQNHINDGLITITSPDKNIPLPSYANKTNFICDPITKELTYNNLTTTNYSKLTQNQIYSITQVANSQNSNSSNLTKGISSKNFGVGPFVQDIFGIIPIKVTGLQPGSNYIEFGGTLQNQERVYFGPVNIHRMSIKLVTDKGDIVDLNNVNWSFSLLCEQLYKQNSSK